MSSINTEVYELSAHQTAYQPVEPEPSNRPPQHELLQVLSIPDRPQLSAHSSSEPLISSDSPALHEKDDIKPPHTLLRKSLSLGLCIAVIVLVVNSSLLIWSISRTGSLTGGGSTTLYEGSCIISKRVSIAAALIINVLSTVLLAVSNNAAQFLCAPTRSEIDAAHEAAGWLDIGQMSFRNLRKIAKRRFMLWILLLLSSWPLHML